MDAGLFGLDWEGWFSLAGMPTMLGWAILILAPRRWPVLNSLPALWFPAMLSVGYSVLILLYFGRVEGGFGSLAEVETLFASKPLLLAGWVHYLAFDMFVGAWIARRADAIGMSRLIQAPVLAMTFMLGPMGLLAFLMLDSGMRRFRLSPAPVKE